MEDFVKNMIKTVTNIIAPEQKFEETSMTFEKIVESYGFPLEIHYVTTKDGYKLKLFRIPRGKSNSNIFCSDGKKYPILFQHGLLDSSDGWICNSEEKSLPFILANMGYDVWLANSRGNKHSKEHIKYDINSYEYWSYSFHEMAVYDLPSILDKITEVNKSNKKIIYIGHSQGTAIMFAGLSLDQQYIKQKIQLIVALAPISRVKGMSSDILSLLHSIKLDDLIHMTGSYEILPESKSINSITHWTNTCFPSFVNTIVNLIADNNSHLNNNTERMEVYLNHFPSGTSLRNIKHFAQLFGSGKFCQYDYGEEANLRIFGNLEPSDYNLEDIFGFKIGLFVGHEDKLSVIDDVNWLKDKLSFSNVVVFKEYENMGHLTFLIPKDLIWFNDVLGFIIRYS